MRCPRAGALSGGVSATRRGHKAVPELLPGVSLDVVRVSRFGEAPAVAQTLRPELQCKEIDRAHEPPPLSNER